MSTALPQKVVFGLGRIDFAPAYPHLRAPRVVGLPISFTGLSAWLALVYVGGR